MIESISDFSKVHLVGSYISGDVCMLKWVPLVLLDKLTRKARVEVDAVRGCLQEASQSSCRAGCHSSS